MHSFLLIFLLSNCRHIQTCIPIIQLHPFSNLAILNICLIFTNWSDPLAHLHSLPWTSANYSWHQAGQSLSNLFTEYLMGCSRCLIATEMQDRMPPPAHPPLTSSVVCQGLSHEGCMHVCHSWLNSLSLLSKHTLIAQRTYGGHSSSSFNTTCSYFHVWLDILSLLLAG